MFDKENAFAGRVGGKARRRRPSARRRAISTTPLIPLSKEKSQAKLYLNNILGWIEAHDKLLILLIILIGVFLRIYDLGTESLWLDEVSRIEFAKNSPSFIIQEAIVNENHPPLYFLILHFWIILFHSSEIAARFPSAIFSIISIFLIYKIGCNLFNQKIGLISSFLLSVSAFHIYYSQDTNPYSLSLFLTLLSFYFFIKILKGNRKWNYIVYILSNILLCYSHLFGFIVVIAQMFYIALFWKKYQQQRLKFAGWQLATMLALIPLVILFMQRFSEVAQGGGGGIAWIPEPSFLSIILTLTSFSGYSLAGICLVPFFFVLSIIGVLSIRWFKGRSSIRFESVEEVTLILIWFSLPIVIPFLLSIIVTPMYVFRYTISALPAFLLLTAKGMVGLSRYLSNSHNNKYTYSMVIFIALISFLGLQWYYTEPINEQWREAAYFIENRTQADDAIIICAGYTEEAFDYYYKGDVGRFGISRDVTDTDVIDAVVDNATMEKERLWLVLSNEGIAITEEYLLSCFGSKSVIEHEELMGVEIYLFDLPGVSP